jgi:hypothetical protein
MTRKLITSTGVAWPVIVTAALLGQAVLTPFTTSGDAAGQVTKP